MFKKEKGRWRVGTERVRSCTLRERGQAVEERSVFAAETKGRPGLVWVEGFVKGGQEETGELKNNTQNI